MKICSNEWRKLDRRAKNKYFNIWRKKDNGNGYYNESGNYVSFGNED